MNEEYKLIPLQKTQSIPISWKFTRGEYDKLVKGHRSNWTVFLRDDVVHVCRVGGEEFYRFAITETGDGMFVASSLEMYVADDFYESARQHGWTKERVDAHQSKLRESATEEVGGLLASHFGVSLT